MKEVLQRVEGGGLNENRARGIIYLNAWSPVWGTVWEGQRLSTLLEEVCLWG